MLVVSLRISLMPLSNMEWAEQLKEVQIGLDLAKTAPRMMFVDYVGIMRPYEERRRKLYERA